jgi:hypothetical protein
MLTNDPTKSFLAHYKMPKKDANRIKKEFRDSKEIKAEIGDKLKDYVQMTAELFDFFEELTEKKVNRSVMDGNMAYWFDEGYDVESMKDYVRNELQNPFFSENPEMFTVANLFPIKNQERINAIWDKLQHFFSIRQTKKSKPTGVQLLLRCGHKVGMDEYRKDPYCTECNQKGLVKEWYENSGKSLKEELLLPFKIKP